MPKETQFAVSVTAHMEDDEGWHVQAHSPTFYLHANVQGLTSEDAAKALVTDWLAKIAAHTNGVDFDVAVAETTVDAPDPQAHALLGAVKRAAPGVVQIYRDPPGLPDGYLLVREDPQRERMGMHSFECGIAPDGRVSS